MKYRGIETIEKESIPEIVFSVNDVLKDDKLTSLRHRKLLKGMVLGNTYHKKIGIIFESNEGTKRVDTTIWATTDKDVLLKGGINLPIRSIKELIFN